MAISILYLNEEIFDGNKPNRVLDIFSRDWLALSGCLDLMNWLLNKRLVDMFIKISPCIIRHNRLSYERFLYWATNNNIIGRGGRNNLSVRPRLGFRFLSVANWVLFSFWILMAE